jgi:prevent-host-death family protein
MQNVRQSCQQMKTATVREAQHHLSKLLVDVEAGAEIVITRRGKSVGKLVPLETSEDGAERKVDWAGWVADQREWLEAAPKIQGSAIEEDRKGYRW